jgi:hypothetical protein
VWPGPTVPRKQDSFVVRRHTTTNINVIAHFVDVAIDLVEEPKRVWTVS